MSSAARPDTNGRADVTVRVHIVAVAVILFMCAGPCTAQAPAPRAGVACPTGSCLSGSVVDVRGKPLGDVLVAADPSTRRPQKGVAPRETRTDAAGRFLLDGLRPGAEYEVRFEAGNRQCDAPTRNVLAIDAPLIETLDEPVVPHFPSFVVLPSGVVSDPETGLEWAPDPGRSMNWHEADRYVRESTFAGGGWRLPTRAELMALYDTSAAGGCGLLGRLSVPNAGKDESFRMQCCYAWSSDLEGDRGAWVVYFQFREDTVYALDHGSYGYSRVLAVRAARK